MNSIFQNILIQILTAAYFHLVTTKNHVVKEISGISLLGSRKCALSPTYSINTILEYKDSATEENVELS